MITYSAAEYANFQDFISAFNQKLIENINLPTVVYHRTYGEGRIVSVKACRSAADLIITIDFRETTKIFSLRTIDHLHLLKMTEADNTSYLNWLDTYSKSFELYKLEQDAEQAAEKVAAAKAVAEAKEKLGAEKRKAKALEKLKALKPENTLGSFESPQTFYETLGWMAKHVKSIKPSMPSNMESWFVSHFGNTDRTVIDSDKKTTGGHAMKYSISFKATFDAELTGLLLDRAKGNTKKVIDSVPFIWDLIENHGFQFGATQELSQIKATVPNTYISEFDRGYGLCA